MEFTVSLLQMPLDEFMPYVREAFLSQSELAGRLLTEEVLNCLMTEAPVKYTGLLSVMAEEELKRAAADGRGGAEFAGLLEDYIRTERMYFEGLFREECFTERGMKWMSAECRCNDILLGFLNGGKKELKLVLEAAKLRPDLAQVLKQWLGELR